MSNIKKSWFRGVLKTSPASKAYIKKRIEILDQPGRRIDHAMAEHELQTYMKGIIEGRGKTKEHRLDENLDLIPVSSKQLKREAREREQKADETKVVSDAPEVKPDEKEETKIVSMK